MIKKLFGLGMIVLVAACSEPAIISNDDAAHGDINVIDGRLIFKDVAAFTGALHQLESVDSKDLMSRLQKLDYVSLGSRLKTAWNMETVPPELVPYQDYGSEHLVLLNSDGIVQIGNDVVKYYGQKKFYLDVSLFGTSDIMSSPRTGDYIITNYSAGGGENARVFSTYLNGTIGSGGAQYDYFLLGDGSHRKFINEWIGTIDTFPGGSCADGQTIVSTYAQLKLRMKMEGRPNSSKPWTIAPELRHLIVDLTINNLELHYYPSTCFGSITTSSFGNIYRYQPIDDSSGSYSYTVASGSYYMRTPLAYSGYWSGDAIGTVTQQYIWPRPPATPGIWFQWTDTFN